MLLYRPLFVMLIMLTTTSCFKPDENLVVVDETRGRLYELYSRYIDENGNKGIVVYAERGKCIIVMSCDEAYLPWGNMGQTIMPSDTIKSVYDNRYGYGIEVLNRMRSIGIEEFPAQKWCDDKNCGNDIYSGSWHLPTIHELKTIFRGGRYSSKIADLNDVLNRFNNTPVIDQEEYWSCIEDIPGAINNDEDKIIGELYDSGNRAIPVRPKLTFNPDKTTWYKKERHNVRAIKYIYYKMLY